METEKMDMEQFAENIREKIEQQGQFEKVSLQNILKNNGVMRCGLLLHSSENNLIPTIYLESFYEKFKNGVSVEEIIREILEIYREEAGDTVNLSFFREFENVKDRICMRLINREKNCELLKDIPYIEFLDLAVCFYYAYNDTVLGPGSILIHNSHMGMWNCSRKMLFELAKVNTLRIFPARLLTMEEVLGEIIAECPGRETKERLKSQPNGGVDMCIISNNRRIYGAVSLIYLKWLDMAADRFGGDFYILPSSVHETIAVPMNGDKGVEGLRAIVKDVNDNQMEREDILSYNVYIYHRDKRSIEIA